MHKKSTQANESASSDLVWFTYICGWMLIDKMWAWHVISTLQPLQIMLKIQYMYDCKLSFACKAYFVSFAYKGSVEEWLDYYYYRFCHGNAAHCSQLRKTYKLCLIKHSLWSYVLTKKLNCSVLHEPLMKDKAMLNTSSSWTLMKLTYRR